MEEWGGETRPFFTMKSRFEFATMIIEMLDDDHGMSWKAFRELYDFLDGNGFKEAAAFTKTVDATDSRFYLDHGLRNELRTAFAIDIDNLQ
jgi:hypothetical protein